MSTFREQLLAEYRDRRQATGRQAETTIGGTTIEIGDSDTVQSVDETILGTGSIRGVPRGREALDARRIAETAPFQMILNAVNDQLLGGELALPSDDEDEDQSEAELKAIITDILEGPHHAGLDLDDLITSWTSDMAVVGNAYAEPLGPGDSSDLPFVALKAVDAITVRHNVSKTGSFEEPAFYQAPFRSAGDVVVSVSEADVTELDRDDLVMFRWPGSERSHRVYPLPPALQLREWLEIIDDSTTHLSRYYSDNELPAGLLTAREATQTDIDTIRDELQAAKGEPRSAPVVGADARWVEVGGSAVDLSHIEEQQWFLQLCMAAFGVPKTELGMDDQVNYSTSESELQVIAKRVTSKVSKTIASALERQLLPQFDLYQSLDQPFGVDLRYSDPREERIEEQRALENWAKGATTYRELREDLGVDMSEEDTTVTINGTTIDYGEHPKHVVEAQLADARSDEDAASPGEEMPGDGGEDGDGE
jgi:hypothetical protein